MLVGKKKKKKKKGASEILQFCWPFSVDVLAVKGLILCFE